MPSSYELLLQFIFVFLWFYNLHSYCKQENVLAESRMMVPDCHKRLESALADLKGALVLSLALPSFFPFLRFCGAWFLKVLCPCPFFVSYLKQTFSSSSSPGWTGRIIRRERPRVRWRSEHNHRDRKFPSDNGRIVVSLTLILITKNGILHWCLIACSSHIWFWMICSFWRVSSSVIHYYHQV